MSNITTEPFVLDDEAIQKLSLSYNFIQCNKLVPLEVERKSYYYSTHFDSIMMSYSADKPVSKILNLTEVFDEDGTII